jgi:hypothetical protein
MAPPLRLLRVANPVVRAVLRSPAHRIHSGSLVVSERPEGRAPIPVLGAPTATGIVALAVAPAAKRWWRRFGSPTPTTLTVRGERRAVRGQVLEDAARREALRAYVGRFPRARGPLALAARDPDDEALDRVDAAVVLFRPEPSG